MVSRIGKRYRKKDLKLDGIYTTADIAGIFGVSKGFVCRWFRNGLLPGYKTMGGHHRTTRQQLIHFLKENKVPLGALASCDTETTANTALR